MPKYENKERDDALIAEVAETFPPDTVDVQSRYVIVHQLRASADIQDAQTKRETRWADTSDRACLMRKAADALDALLANWQPPAEPDRAEQAWFDAYDAYDVAGDSNAAASIIRAAMAEAAAERPVIDVPEFTESEVAMARHSSTQYFSANEYALAHVVLRVAGEQS